MLLDSLAEHGQIDESGNIVLSRGEDGSMQVVPVDVFTTFFGASETYDELIGEHTFTWNDVQYTKTAEELGYKQVFDVWKAQGIIN